MLEVILALVIFAASAMLVVSTIPSKSAPDIFGQQFKSLVEYGSDRAVMDGNILGLVITDREFQLVMAQQKNETTHWVPLEAGRITTHGQFPEDMHVSLSPMRLAATLGSEPQILFLPDGETGRFTLMLQTDDSAHRFRVVSQGASSVIVESER